METWGKKGRKERTSVRRNQCWMFPVFTMIVKMLWLRVKNSRMKENTEILSGDEEEKKKCLNRIPNFRWRTFLSWPLLDTVFLAQGRDIFYLAFAWYSTFTLMCYLTMRLFWSSLKEDTCKPLRFYVSYLSSIYHTSLLHACVTVNCAIKEYIL